MSDDGWALLSDEIDTGPYAVRYYDRQGNPISMRKWGQLRYENARDDGGRDTDETEGLRVKSTVVGPHWVSTVWLGLDHSHGGGRPLIFETVVFGPEGMRDDQWMNRYTTEAEARAGHDEIVTVIRATLP